MVTGKEKSAVSRYIGGLFDGRCDIYEYVAETAENGSSVQKEQAAALDVPCRLSYTTRLSYSGLKSSGGYAAVPANNAVQQIKLFLGPDITVKPGSKVVVTQNGVTEAYKNSGEAAVYPSHTEIVLEKAEKWV